MLIPPKSHWIIPALANVQQRNPLQHHLRARPGKTRQRLSPAFRQRKWRKGGRSPRLCNKYYTAKSVRKEKKNQRRASGGNLSVIGQRSLEISWRRSFSIPAAAATAMMKKRNRSPGAGGTGRGSCNIGDDDAAATAAPPPAGSKSSSSPASMNGLLQRASQLLCQSETMNLLTSITSNSIANNLRVRARAAWGYAEARAPWCAGVCEGRRIYVWYRGGECSRDYSCRCLVRWRRKDVSLCRWIFVLGIMPYDCKYFDALKIRIQCSLVLWSISNMV